MQASTSVVSADTACSLPGLPGSSKKTVNPKPEVGFGTLSSEGLVHKGLHSFPMKARKRLCTPGRLQTSNMTVCLGFRVVCHGFYRGFRVPDWPCRSFGSEALSYRPLMAAPIS